MNKQDILEIIKDKIINILPELSEDDIEPAKQLSDLGLNSIDRAEVVTNTMEELELKIPRVKFAGGKSISELTDLFCEEKNKTC